MDINQHHVTKITMDHSKLSDGKRVLKMIIKSESGEVIMINLFSDDGPIPIMVCE